MMGMVLQRPQQFKAGCSLVISAAIMRQITGSSPGPILMYWKQLTFALSPSGLSNFMAWRSFSPGLDPAHSGSATVSKQWFSSSELAPRSGSCLWWVLDFGLKSLFWRCLPYNYCLKQHNRTLHLCNTSLQASVSLEQTVSNSPGQHLDEGP